MLLSTALSWTTVVLGLLAAVLWFWSTRVRYMKHHADITPTERSIWLFSNNTELHQAAPWWLAMQIIAI